jgi:hypothetical protein
VCRTHDYEAVKKLKEFLTSYIAMIYWPLIQHGREAKAWVISPRSR